MDLKEEKKYLRIEATVYVELKPGEEPEEAEDRFLFALPFGMDCVGYKSEMWLPEA